MANVRLDGPTRWHQTRLIEPIFRYPPQEPHTFTAPDLINILKFCKIRGIVPTTQKHQHPKPNTRAVQTDPDRTRKIFRVWPRDPNGKFFAPDDPCRGKRAPNDIDLWGSTIHDFYYVNRSPEMFGMMGMTTGSRMLKWVEANDELDHAKHEIEWAEWEPSPELIQPWSIEDAIIGTEEMIKQGKIGKSLPTKGKARTTGAAFDLSKYPNPWPLVPFSYPTERLTSIIDQTNLPRKLVVHDPWNLLTGYACKDDLGSLASKPGCAWTTKPDRTITFRLNPYEEEDPPSADEGVNGDVSMASPPINRDDGIDASADSPPIDGDNNNDDDDDDLSTVPSPEVYERILWDVQPIWELDVWGNRNTFYLVPPHSPGPLPPPVLVVYMPPPHIKTPTTPKPIEEAHLYLSPLFCAGSGNHSVVYRAELELPRDAVIPEPSEFVFCIECAEEDAWRTLKILDGENGERMDPQWKENSAWVERFFCNGRPPLVPDPNQDNIPENVTAYIPDPSQPTGLRYRGKRRLIKSNVEWQYRKNPTCPHLSHPSSSPPSVLPPTVKVSVIAKLSIQNDSHLAREAGHYQRFPQHMFEHWSGLNLVRPLRDPVPIAPVFPQFYGYYVPDVKGDNKGKNYISPILLLEDCGEQVEDVSALTSDQRQEAISLLFRFHHADWFHGSVYPRNFLMQPGPLTVPPDERSIDTPSFRLVDFGRSERLKNEEDREEFCHWDNQRREEASVMKRMFRLSPELY